MIELRETNVLDYLRETGRLLPGDRCSAELLGWGVSNIVMRIQLETGTDFVIKQSRVKLRTKVDWRSRLDRVWREAEVMQHLSGLLPPGTIPAVRFEDRDNYLFAMEAVEADHTVWKETLLNGETDDRVADLAAEVLATIHGQTAADKDLIQRWGDITVFEELRLDPFYRYVADRNDVLKPQLFDLIDDTSGRQHCVVSADFSPKNVLVTRTGISLVDFETAHCGDPAFDLGFFFSHLLLKTILHARDRERFLALATIFWDRYCRELKPARPCQAMEITALAERSVRHLAACLIARIDGKSPVEYLDERQQQVARRLAMNLFTSPSKNPAEVFERLDLLLRP